MLSTDFIFCSLFILATPVVFKSANYIPDDWIYRCLWDSFINPYVNNITVNITNSSGGSVNVSTSLNVALSQNSTIGANLLNINTSSWNEGTYTIKAEVIGDNFTGTRERSESFIFRYINITTSSVKYMCNVTTEEFNVIIDHPFTDSITYNVSLAVPAGCRLCYMLS